MLISAVEFGKLKNDFYTQNLNKKAKLQVHFKTLNSE